MEARGFLIIGITLFVLIAVALFNCFLARFEPKPMCALCKSEEAKCIYRTNLGKMYMLCDDCFRRSRQ